MKQKKVFDFFNVLCEKDPFQEKHINSLNLSDIDYDGFELFLNFCENARGETMESLADAYLFLNNMIMKETFYFKKNKRYRHSTVAEVEEDVYNNPDYMEKYMKGLSISDYMWPQHLKMLEFFDKCLEDVGGAYLEIGPGCGQLLTRAVISKKFESMQACDLSATSANICNEFLNYIDKKDECHVNIKNFFHYGNAYRFDYIVMGEVLEHVEKPEEMLAKIKSLLNENGRAFISTVINAPAIDHIYLFKDIDHVTQMMRKSGFEIVNYMTACIGGISIEKAMKQSDAVDIAMLVKHK